MRYAIAETSSFLLLRGGGSVPYMDRHLSFSSFTFRSNRGAIPAEIFAVSPPGPLAKEWELNHLAERLDALAKRG